MAFDEELSFSGRILDNVHGFISYTETEEQIINTLLFKRLQSIKQLSIVNWVFPGSEHTRFIHSLGVMFVADKMAKQLGLTIEERKLVRLAGLLHDIGHYPLSHVCEYPYKGSSESFPDEQYCEKVNSKVKEQIDNWTFKPTLEFMRKSTGFHHEKIGAEIVRNNEEIRRLIVAECGEKAPGIIADMIIGNVDRDDINPILVQILHSELDADGIDYLMRDAMFSGTSFGAFELEQLIGCMETVDYEGKGILCITAKGIAAADQYLINKFFSYSQVVYNKHISITEWMAEQIVDWMQKNNAYFPRSEKLKKWISDSDDQYIDFTDNHFWTSLKNMLDNPLVDTEPEIIKFFCRQLLRHKELPYVKDSEVKIVSGDVETIRNELQNSSTYKRIAGWKDCIVLFNSRRMSKQISESDFERALLEKLEYGYANPDEPDIIGPEDIVMWRQKRFMECITIKEQDGTLHLLCDDKRSLMQNLYNQYLVFLRAFECKVDIDNN